jgi:hypothetical protein
MELACIEDKLFNRPVKLLTSPEVEHMLEHSRRVWERRAAGV